MVCRTFTQPHRLPRPHHRSALMKGVEVHAVGVATPAVLTRELADGCADYVTSVVLQHDVVPRFSIHNVFEMKKEMDDTKWGDVLADRIKDWCVFWGCVLLCVCVVCLCCVFVLCVCVFVWSCWPPDVLEQIRNVPPLLTQHH